jgi:hypothetical protein
MLLHDAVDDGHADPEPLRRLVKGLKILRMVSSVAGAVETDNLA